MGGGKGEGGRRGLPSAVATVVGMNDMTTLHDAIGDFPRRKAQTLRFSCGAPRSATAIGDGSRALFLRSDGPEDLVTSLWLSVFDADGTHREVLLADPRVLLADVMTRTCPPRRRPVASAPVKAARALSRIRWMRLAAVWSSRSTVSCS